MHLISVLLLLPAVAVVAVPFVVPWSKEQFGPEGPWNAVQIRVGGSDPNITIAAQGNTAVVNLFPGGPGGRYATYVLHSDVCEPYGSTSSCGAGGTWQPDGSTEVAYPPDWVDSSWGLNSTNNTLYNTKAITIGETIVFNCSIASVQEASVTGLDGTKYAPTLGSFALGIDDGQQFQGFSLDNTVELDPVVAWEFSGYLYNQGDIASYSYGLQIGAAAFKYSGSLLFGGYDKGRAIGPFTSYNTANKEANAPTLLDIEIGVEVGGSPFTFKNQTGLLRTGSSDQTQINASLDPISPYISLPGETCEAIAQLLPVTLDRSSGYYLWNVDDPQYNKIVTSPAYLKFVFPPAAGDSERVGIKVPFALLNLMLENPIMVQPTPYFPCRSHTPKSSEFFDSYRLGRAFLQAAFLGQNYNTRTVWLAQAPGPGETGEGMGLLLTELDDRATSIDLFQEDGHFARSWKNHWVILPDDESPPPANEPEEPKDTPSLEESPKEAPFFLSTAAKAGIGAGAGAAFLLAVISVILALKRRRRNRQRRLKEERDARDAALPYEDIKYDRYGAAPINAVPLQLSAGPDSPRELDSTIKQPTTPLYELPGHYLERPLDRNATRGRTV